MTWTKLSDDYTDDCWTLSHAAYRLHTDGLIWSNRKLLDRVIPKEDLPRFAKSPDAIQELLDAGYWRDTGVAYVIRHHAQYQRDREAVINQQSTNRANGRKGGRPKGMPREQKTHSVSDSQSDSRTGGFPGPTPHPDTTNLESVGQKTQSVSDSLSNLPTKRDGPGIEVRNRPKKSNWTQEMDDEWKAYGPVPGGRSLPRALPLTSNVSEPSSMDFVSCEVCGVALEGRNRGGGAEECLRCSDLRDSGVPASDGPRTQGPGFDGKGSAGAFAIGLSDLGPPDTGTGGCSIPGCLGPVTDYLRREYGSVCFAHREVSP